MLLLAILLLPLLALAQLDNLRDGLSSGCVLSASSLVATNFGTCANLVGFVNVASAGNGSLAKPVESWSSGLCASEYCDQEDLEQALNIVESGCSADKEKQFPKLALQLIQHYQTYRALLCQKHTANTTYCLSDLVDHVETSLQQNVSINTFAEILAGPGLINLYRVASSDVCSDCGQAVIAQSRALNKEMQVPEDTQKLFTQAVEDKCGKSFGESIPSTVQLGGVASPKSSGAESTVPRLAMYLSIGNVILGMNQLLTLAVRNS